MPGCATRERPTLVHPVANPYTARVCGRYALDVPGRALHDAFDTKPPIVDFSPRYNIAPSQRVPVVVKASYRVFEWMRWGLVNPKSQRLPVRSHINARVETLSKLATFRGAYAQRRCLVPATGFYEWASSTKPKTPMYIHRPSREIFAFAGLWEPSVDPARPEPTFCIVTTQARGGIEVIHERMPVVLAASDYERWLTGGPMSSQTLAEHALHTFVMHAVSPRVNTPAYDDVACIMPNAD